MASKALAAASKHRRCFTAAGTRHLQSHSRRTTHTSSYDKEVDDHVCPVLVPDIPTAGEKKYWGPNPQTGVFGPSAKYGANVKSGSAAPGNGTSVLEQTVWFRPLEDIEKPINPSL